MEAYAAEKKKLFHMTKLAVFNADDAHTPYMQEGLGCNQLTYGIENKADIMAKDIELGAAGVKYTLSTPIGDGRIELGIPGLFSVYNSLACATACYGFGLTLEQIVNGLHQVHTVPGQGIHGGYRLFGAGRSDFRAGRYHPHDLSAAGDGLYVYFKHHFRHPAGGQL